MTVHNHGPAEGRGLDCPETRLPDGSLRGACMIILTDDERQLAGKLADAGPSEEAAEAWLAELLEAREMRLRKQIAAEIEARRVHIHAGPLSACVDGCGWMDYAARIARGGAS